MDTALVGELAAKAIDGLLEDGLDGEVCDVALVLAIEDGEGTTVRVYATTTRWHEKIGLLHAGLNVLETE